jgi:hypothetical protein
MYFDTQDVYMKEVITDFNKFLMSEWLLSSIYEWKEEWDIKSIFNIDEKVATFSLKQ